MGDPKPQAAEAGPAQQNQTNKVCPVAAQPATPTDIKWAEKSEPHRYVPNPPGMEAAEAHAIGIVLTSASASLVAVLAALRLSKCTSINFCGLRCDRSVGGEPKPIPPVSTDPQSDL